MRIAQPVRFGAWSVIILNLVTAVISIWVLLRISPAIETILVQNDSSLKACEEMLVTLSLSADTAVSKDSLIAVFGKALTEAEKNIYEKSEPETIKNIKTVYRSAVMGDRDAHHQAVVLIRQLSAVNRDAMVRADREARRFGNAGAWIIVAMTLFIFAAGLLLTRSLGRNIIEPMEEIISVITAHKHGERQRRCALGDYPADIRLLFVEINNFLDRSSRPVEHHFIRNDQGQHK